MLKREITLEDIQEAKAGLEGVIHETGLDFSKTFSELSGNEVYLKTENLQKTGSFKIRGAFNKIRVLSDEEKARGVIAASAGNHAQGVAFSATKAGIKSTVVMPAVAPIAKVMATRSYGAEVVLAGQAYDEAYQKAVEIQKETGATFVHPFNDPYVIAGQGTIGLEILEALPDVEAVLLPIGGGGLISGVALAVKYMRPEVKVIGVQASGAAAMYLSKMQGKIVTLAQSGTIADGINVKVPGDLTFEIINRYVDEIVTVEDEEIASAVLLLLERSKILVEGAGAVGVAALIHNKVGLKGKKVVAVTSGGNIDINMVSQIIERGLVKAGRRIRLTTLLPDKPGSLQKLLSVIANANANVIAVYHERSNPKVPIGQAEVELSLETRDRSHVQELLLLLKSQGYDVNLIG